MQSFMMSLQGLLLIYLYSYMSLAFLQPNVPRFHQEPLSKYRRRTKIQRLSIDSIQAIDENTGQHNIQGLPDRFSFSRGQALHNTIRNLQKHLPSLLQTPLCIDDAIQTYQEDIHLTLNLTQGREIVLTSGRNELVALSTGIVAGNQATTQVSQILSSSFLGRSFLQNQVKNSIVTSLLGKLVHCDLWIDEASLLKDYKEANSSLLIHVDWSATVPSSLTAIADLIPSSTSKYNPTVDLNQILESQSNITGQSLLTINGDTPLVMKHQIYSLDINGRDVLSVARTAESIASSLRENAMAFMQGNAFIQSFVNIAGRNNTSGFPALNALRDGVLQQIQQQSTRLLSASKLEDSGSEKEVIAPLFVSKKLHNTNSSDEMSNAKEILIPIDDYLSEISPSNHSLSIPYPGTKLWDKFTLCYKVITHFYNEGLHALVTGKGVSDAKIFDFQNLFDREAKLETNDGILLLSGRTTDDSIRVAKMYQNLSQMRRATNGDWQLKSFKVMDWSSMTCSITWETQTPIRIRGEDEFTLKLCNIENIQDDPMYQITKVKQKYLEVNNVSVKDIDWIRAMIFAIEQSSPQLSMIPTDNALIDLLRQLGSGTSKPQMQSKIIIGPPTLTDSASASVYRAMRAFYLDTAEFPDIKTIYPAAAHVSDKIVLRGLIDETLAKGRESYTQAWIVASRALKVLLSTNQIRMDSSPKTSTVELTNEGLIRTHMMFQLRIDPNLPNPLNVLLSPNKDEKVNKGIPLKFELISEYKLNENGEISEHRLCESKINGRLTPGDVLSRWILGKDGIQRSSDTSSLAQILDFVKWMQDYTGS